MAKPVIKPIDTSAMKDDALSWNLNEIQEWASREFPAFFNALPAVGDLKFLKWDNNVHILCIGKCKRNSEMGTEGRATTMKIYASTSGPWDIRKRGIRKTGRRGIRMELLLKNKTTKDYNILSSDFKFCSDEISRFENGFRGLHHPFCFLGDGVNNLRPLHRLRALVTYYFMAAGYIDLVGGYNGFLLEFKYACYWIANGGEMPPRLELLSTPRRLRNNVGTTQEQNDQGTETSPPEKGPDLNGGSHPHHGWRHIYNSDHEIPLHATKPPKDTSSSRGTVTKLEKPALDMVPTENNTLDVEPMRKLASHRMDLKRLFNEAIDEYEKTQTRNKRLKQDVDALYANEVQLKSTIGSLTIDNAKLRQKLEMGDYRAESLVQERDELLMNIGKTKEELAAAMNEARAAKKWASDAEKRAVDAEKGVIDAEKRATDSEKKVNSAGKSRKSRIVEERKELEAHIEEGKVKIAKAEAERDEAIWSKKAKEEALDEAFRDIKTELGGIAKKERQRADEAEAKLAGIEKFFGKKI